MVWALEKFYPFVFGRHFDVYTDHEPLVGVFRGTDLSAVYKRLQRYVLKKHAYDFTLHYRRGGENVLADFCSRFPDAWVGPGDVKEELFVNSLQMGSEFQINLELFRAKTDKDDTLSTLRTLLQKGYPRKGVSAGLRPFVLLWRSLSVEGGLVTYNGRVVVPASLRERVLELLHQPHLGIVRTKALARQYVFWIGLNRELEVCEKL